MYKKLFVLAPFRLTLVLVFYLCLAGVSEALQPGDRISSLSQTLHSDTKTQWTDMPLHQMPRFASPERTIFRAQIPKYSPNATDFRINPKKDLKVAFTFQGSKFSIPWIPIFDARNRISMQKLIVTFTHDEFEIVSLKYETVCKYRKSSTSSDIFCETIIFLLLGTPAILYAPLTP